ncbi:MAG: TonB family protein [Aquamicrobium sp.]|uniref:cell envelope integrity protein TolA n=1 Tax=Aquamicrobium sp. TaxID=1872579 RepID=UPI00349E4924|nr:TonB family protein [Aquamicrobium sp.]
MKTGLTTSLALHAVALGVGLVTFSSPSPLELTNVESFPVDIVPIEEVAQSVRGDRQAPVAERPAPTPTTRPDVVENAREVGDNTTDLATPPTPDPKPRPVETAEAPPPAPEPTPPTPEPEPAPQPERQPEPQPVPTTEVAPEPQPKQEVAPDPVPETTVAEAPRPDAPELPTSAPRPEARPQPQPPQAQAPRTPERREPERPREQRRETASSESQSQNVEDQVAALLNRERASGGGARRSNDEAALGGRQTTGAKLSQSEEDAIRRQLISCWNVPAGAIGASDLKTTIRFRLDPSGALEGQPAVEKSSGDRVFDDSTLRAVRVCNQRGFQLPADKYDAWADVTVNFDPRDMF